MRPSEALARNRDEVLEITVRYPVSNPRVFGSVARGEDAEGSDLDMLVHPEGRVGYFELANLALEFERVLGCRVDIGEDTSIRAHAKDGIMADARSI